MPRIWGSKQITVSKQLKNTANSKLPLLSNIGQTNYPESISHQAIENFPGISGN